MRLASGTGWAFEAKKGTRILERVVSAAVRSADDDDDDDDDNDDAV